MQVINEDPLEKQVRVNWKTAVKNPYIDKISIEDRISMVIDALYEDSKLSIKDFTKVVNKSLSSLV